MNNTEMYRKRAMDLLMLERESARLRKEGAQWREQGEVGYYEAGREDAFIKAESLLWSMSLQEEAPSKDDARDDSKTHFVELHPPYPGAVWTSSCRGALYSGRNTVDRSIGQEVVSHRAHNYYEVTSGEASLQDYWVALTWTIPDDFKEWMTENPVVIDFRSSSGTYLNSHVCVRIYKAGRANGLSESSYNVNTGWAVIVMEPADTPPFHSGMDVKGWKSGDVMEIYLQLASRNNYYARVGSIRFNYVAK